MVGINPDLEIMNPALYQSIIDTRVQIYCKISTLINLTEYKKLDKQTGMPDKKL